MASERSKRIVITGCTRGIGEALAERFVDLGHTVLGCGRSEEKILELRARHGHPHDFQAVDVSREEQVAAWARGLLAGHPPPDLVINNAALINEPAPLWEVAATDFSALVDVNIKGVASVIRHLVPAMVERGSGVIVNLSSGWGRSTSPGVAPYCATKWAIEGLSGALAQELPAGLACIALSPGVVHTEMLEVAFGRDGAALHSDPRAWSRRAAPFILALDAADNGSSLETPI